MAQNLYTSCETLKLTSQCYREWLFEQMILNYSITKLPKLSILPSWLPWFPRFRGLYSIRSVDKPGAAVFPSRDNSDIPKATQRLNDHVRGVSKYALSSAAVLDLAFFKTFLKSRMRTSLLNIAD